ncbi:hypothetical protein [Aliikangiella coralliicola]|uniref:Uncharacterized protein n=1 Tax=Aliikangiella coralliicola TaxID=2592383 RepID=A0A545U0A3_9GAMM|nr:hypothetical protein [Aliikangiella coralliicola]TQV82863.1 hypothetical protein FLL46_24140 [Aliikangiella coralliicola]
MPEPFEIIYEDETVISGTTKAEFEAAPNAGIQFLIVQYEDGHIEKHKALDTYEYQGATKPGSWTTLENFETLKGRILELSNLMVAPVLTRREERALERARNA